MTPNRKNKYRRTEKARTGGQETSGSQERKGKAHLDFKSAAISAQTCTISLASFLFQLLRIKVQTPNHST